MRPAVQLLILLEELRSMLNKEGIAVYFVDAARGAAEGDRLPGGGGMEMRRTVSA